MTALTTAGVVGTDDAVPILDPGQWKQRALHQVWLGKEASGRYVANKYDWIEDVLGNTGSFIVTDVDPTTLIPTMIPRKAPNLIGLSDEDIILGVGPGTQSDTYRVYIDKSVRPFRLCTDQRYDVKGELNTSAKFFRGSIAQNNMKVISAFFDTSGNLLGEDVPLVLVDKEDNVSVKQVMPCYTVEDLPDNEPVTVVVYLADGTVSSQRVFLTQNSSFIAKPGSPKKYITGISLKSLFLSKNDPNLLQFPMNVPVQALGLMGVVSYSNGDTLEMPVDGTKFTIHGLESYLATIPGQPLKLTLTYNLSPDEVSYNAKVGEVPFLEAEYKATTLVADGAYSVKLFGYPVWIDNIHGYRLEWYLYNLDRQTVYKCTPYVRINSNTPAFDPLNYGVRQALSVSVNLKDVNPAFNAYIHTQTIDISLMGPGTSRQTNWTIAFDPGQDPQFGTNNAAKTRFIDASTYSVQLDQGETDQAVWLNRMYRLTKPLYDTSREIQAPDPTHFAIVSGDQSAEFPIASWNTVMTVGFPLNDSSTLYLKFFKRTVDNDIQLAVAGIPVYQQN